MKLLRERISNAFLVLVQQGVGTKLGTLANKLQVRHTEDTNFDLELLLDLSLKTSVLTHSQHAHTMTSDMLSQDGKGVLDEEQPLTSVHGRQALRDAVNEDGNQSLGMLQEVGIRRNVGSGYSRIMNPNRPPLTQYLNHVAMKSR